MGRAIAVAFHLRIGLAFAFPSSGPHKPIQGQPRVVGTGGDPGLPGLILRGPTAGAAPHSANPTPRDWRPRVSEDERNIPTARNIIKDYFPAQYSFVVSRKAVS